MLDEPTNQLDLETVETHEQALLSYTGTLVLVSHDLAFLDKLTSRTWHVHHGQFGDHPGPPSEHLERRKAEAVPKSP